MFGGSGTTRLLTKALISVGVFATAVPAHAYVDPGAGSLLVQLLIGGVAGGWLAIRMFRARLGQRWRSFRARHRRAE